MSGQHIDIDYINKRIRATDYLVVAQLFLQNNYLLENQLSFDDIKPRLLGHWGTCHGINLCYSNLKYHFKDDENFSFILGPGHGFPALQANLFLDEELKKVDDNATLNYDGIAYLCKKFSWPDGFPSHSSPITPTVITEGGELGYALGAAYGTCLGHPEKTVAVLIGDGEFETATSIASMNLNRILSSEFNGKVIPILHLNGYKISGPTIYARKTERELKELIRGFGFTPLFIEDEAPETFQAALRSPVPNPFIVMKTRKGNTGPEFVEGRKIADNYVAHQIPLKDAKTDPIQLNELEKWLKSYNFNELFSREEGFKL